MEMIHLFYVYRYVYQYLLSSTPVYLKNKFDVKSSHNTKFYIFQINICGKTLLSIGSYQEASLQ